MTDADALLDSQALRLLVPHLADDRVGGVGGRRLIRRDEAQMKEAQQSYISADSGIKAWESRLGYTTANDGKLYAVRRELIDEIAEGVTDDLYAALKVVSSGKRFLFEPLAFAEIKVPSRHPMHEITRRRRVVCRSLTGIWKMREVLNPLRCGMFSVGLLVNKVLRRLLPVFLMLLFVGSLSLAVAVPSTWPLLAAQLLFFFMAASHVAPWQSALPSKVAKLSQIAFYFCIGNYGTLLGLYDFLSGKRVLRWEPVKQDQFS
jgi:cellulose synthase/poly-beta-1,6-N-acetylglucosamine synthase-like glycosyltransferase